VPRRRGLNRGGSRRGAAARLALGLAGALAAWLGAQPSAAATLREVRIGRHADYTRVVFETDAPVRYRLVREGEGELRIRLEASASPRRVGSKSDVLREVVVEGAQGAAVARLALERGDVDVREMVLENPPRIVLDLTPRAAAARAKPGPAKVARAETPATPGKGAPAKDARGAKRARAEKPIVEVQPREPAPDAAAAARPPAGEPARAAAEPAAAGVPAPSQTRAGDALREPAPAPGAAPAPAPTPAASPEPSAAPELAGPPAPAGAPSVRGDLEEPSTTAGAPPPAPPSAAPAPSAHARTAERSAVPPATAPEAAPAGEAPGDAPAPPSGAEPPAPAPEPFDAAAARLAQAERELERLAGIPPHRRRDRLRAEGKPEKAGRGGAGARGERALARAGEPPAAAGDARGETADAAREPEPGAPEGGAADPGAARADDPADALRRAHEKAARVRAAQRAAGTPIAPGPLAFLPSPFDDPFVLSGIGALLVLIAALAVVRRRAARDAERLPSPFEAAEARAPGAEGQAGEAGHSERAAAPPADLGPLFASAAAAPSEPEGSIFDVPAQAAPAAAAEAEAPGAGAPAFETRVESAPAFEPAAAPPVAPAAAASQEEELTEEEMRLIEELERRLARIETRLEEVVDAKERLERHVAAQTEELRVQRAAIARTQRVLRTIVKPEDVATEPVSKT